MQLIQVTVYGWPNKANNQEETRLYFPVGCEVAREKTSEIFNKLGGLYKISAYAIPETERPERSEAEIVRGQDILLSLEGNRLH
jgi:hypothetical protein